MLNREGSTLRTEVSPVVVAIVIGAVLLTLAVGYFVFQSRRAPKFLTGNSSATTLPGQSEREQRLRKDEVTGLPTTRD